MKKIGRPKKYDFDLIIEDLERGLSRELVQDKYKINSNVLKTRLCDYKKGRLKREKITVTMRIDYELYLKLKKG